MPVFRLDRRRPIFPPAALAEPDGLLAIGGDLAPERLLAAYRAGIFPWYDQPGGPILWWSPDPRLVLEPARLQVSRRLRRTLRQGRFAVRFDTAFDRVIRSCAEREETWINVEIERAMLELHALGHAHSLEVWKGKTLVGGLYGVKLGRAFFGESMFSTATDASKVALARLVSECRARNVPLIDCQMPSPHLASLGSRSIPRWDFESRLAELINSRVPVWRENHI